MLTAEEKKHRKEELSEFDEIVLAFLECYHSRIRKELKNGKTV